MNLKISIIGIYWMILLSLYFDIFQWLDFNSFENTHLFNRDRFFYLSSTARLFLYAALAFMPVFLWFCVDEFFIKPRRDESSDEEF